VLEALIAAVYLDHGFAVTEQFVLEILDAETAENTVSGTIIDYKSQLQELLTGESAAKHLSTI